MHAIARILAVLFGRCHHPNVRWFDIGFDKGWYCPDCHWQTEDVNWKKRP
jgi:hypothetical protein